MTVLIAGCGDLGTEAGLRFAAAGFPVLGWRRSPEKIPAPLAGRAADLTGTLPRVPADTDIVVICVAAGERTEAAYRSAYVDGTSNVLDALERDGVQPRRILFVSSTAVYGDADGGWLDEVLMRICDAITAFPSILLCLVLIAIFGSGKYNIILSLGILFVPSFSRIVRAEVANQKALDYVRSAKLMGVGDMRILFVHIMPNIVPVLLSAVAIGFNNAVLAEASMSYLGVGVQPPDPSLGRMLSEAQTYLLSAPWYALSVGGAIILLILGFGLLSEGLGGDKNA